jgi:hypothetical protein
LKDGGPAHHRLAFFMLTHYENKAGPRVSARPQTWFIVASGPSLTREDVDSIRGQRVMVINDNFLLAPWAEVLYASDGYWWDWHAERVKSFKGRKITQDKQAAEDYQLEYIRGVDADGISRDPAVIHTGANSGVAAINLSAVRFGARRIVLLGFDMQATGGKAHWFGEHAWIQRDPAEGTWHRWLRRYQVVADDARDMGIEIINATRETALRCFPRVPLASLLPALV